MASRSSRHRSSTRHRHRPAAGQDRAHLVGRVGDRRVEHGVAVRACAAAATAAACRRTPWCRRRPRSGRRDVDVEAAGDPRCGRRAQLRRADARRVAPLAVRRRPARRTTAARRRVARRADRQVDDAPGEGVGRRLRAGRAGRTGTAAGRSRSIDRSESAAGRRCGVAGRCAAGRAARSTTNSAQPPGGGVVEPGPHAHTAVGRRSSTRPRPRGGRRPARRRARRGRPARRRWSSARSRSAERCAAGRRCPRR